MQRESYFQLPNDQRLELLQAGAQATGRPAHLLEKDIWVVRTLEHLFGGSHQELLVFKGGTSLSKAYKVIDRFSEDVDMTYDIRGIAGDLVKEGDNALPPSRSQAKKWTKEIRRRLADWISMNLVPPLQADLSELGAVVTAAPTNDGASITYPALAQGTGYVTSIVSLEFGARSTGEPNDLIRITCDVADHIRDVAFPTANARVMKAERTFWEKATAMHVFCRRGEFRGGEHFARHWYDVVRLDAHGYADRAIADIALAEEVAAHKSMFFAERDAKGEAIDYREGIFGSLEIVPAGDERTALETDYEAMVADGLFFDEQESFSDLMDHCEAVQEKVNAVGKSRQRPASG